MLWVNRIISGAASDFRFSPESDRIAALRKPTQSANNGQGGADDRRGAEGPIGDLGLSESTETRYHYCSLFTVQIRI
jgi:hypothetical protein